MTPTLKDLEMEPLSVGRIGVNDAQASAAAGQDIFAERVEERIMELLTKYGCRLVVSGFHWEHGHCSGQIGVVRRPD